MKIKIYYLREINIRILHKFKLGFTNISQHVLYVNFYLNPCISAILKVRDFKF